MLPNSAKPYLVRAICEWCANQGYTPYMIIRVDEHCRVPRAYVRDGSITLNVGHQAVPDLHIDDAWVSFTARFNGVSQQVAFPILAIEAVYAKETQEGMGFVPAKYEGEEPSTQASTPKKPTLSLLD